MLRAETQPKRPEITKHGDCGGGEVGAAAGGRQTEHPAGRVGETRGGEFPYEERGDGTWVLTEPVWILLKRKTAAGGAGAGPKTTWPSGWEVPADGTGSESFLETPRRQRGWTSWPAGGAGRTPAECHPAVRSPARTPRTACCVDAAGRMAPRAVWLRLCGHLG